MKLVRMLKLFSMQLKLLCVVAITDIFCKWNEPSQKSLVKLGFKETRNIAFPREQKKMFF